MAEIVLVEAADGLTLVVVRGKLDAAGVGAVDSKPTGVARARDSRVDPERLPALGSTRFR